MMRTLTCLQVCRGHVGTRGTDEADVHYRAVCRALVAEAQELSSFLQKVSEGTNDLYLRTDTVASSEALDNLNFQDWVRNVKSKTTNVCAFRRIQNMYIQLVPPRSAGQDQFMTYR